MRISGPCPGSPDHAPGNEVAQRREKIECQQPGPARNPEWGKVVREQADDTVGESHAATAIQLAATNVRGERARRAGIVVVLFQKDLGQLPGIAQAKIEALAGNRV